MAAPPVESPEQQTDGGAILSKKKRKQLSLREVLAKLRLLDDEFMRMALQDQIDIVEYILQIAMRKPKLRVTRMETQKDLLQLGKGRSVVLDVYAQDEDGTQYDIEVQRDSSGADGRRARYHHDLMDAVYLRQSDKIKKLPNAVVIFITEKDCFGTGDVVKEFLWRDDTGLKLETGQQTIYINTAFKGTPAPKDVEIAALAHDFACTDPEEMKLKPLADRVRFLKCTEEGRVQMSDVVAAYAKQQAKKARLQAEKKAKKAKRKAQERVAAAEAKAHEAELARDQAAREAAEMRGSTDALVRELYYRQNYSVQEIAALTSLSAATVNEICSAPAL